MQVIAGMRSGHHAIIHWLLCHFAGVTAFRNNPLGPEHWVYRNAGEAYRAADRVRPQVKDCYLFNLEDVPVGTALEILTRRREDLSWGASARVVRILVLRDLENFIASRMQAEERRIPGFPWDDWTGLWLSHARAFVSPPGDAELVRVSYDAWVFDLAYRRRLSARLGLAFTDAGRDHVPAIGAGSSFDGTRYDGQAARMRVFDRWRAFTDHPRWRFHTADPEARALSRHIFGPPGGPPRTDLEF